MNVDIDSLLNESITLLTRLDAKSLKQPEDVWEATVLNGSWSEAETRSLEADGTERLGRSVRVQFPSDVGTFTPYQEYVSEGLNGAKSGRYTVNGSSYVIRGDKGLKSRLSASEALDAARRYGGARVREWRDLTTDAIGGMSDVTRFASVLYIQAS